MGIDVYKVFTPTVPATLNFVERRGVNDQVVDALRTPGRQLIVYGETGSGKSTLLLNKLDQVYEGQVVTRCTAKTSFDQLMLSAFDDMAPYFVSSVTFSKSSSIGSSLTSAFSSIQAAIEARREEGVERTLTPVVPPQLTPERLGQFLGELGFCWVLEDFHKVAPEEKVHISQCLKIFCDLAHLYPSVKIIAVGATDTARQVVQYDPEMNNRVGEIEVPLMSDEELLAVVQGGERLLSVDFGTTKPLIVLYSMGVASICHQLCLNMCVNRSVFETAPTSVKFDATDVQAALERYIKDTSDTLKSNFDLALRRHRVRRWDNARIILKALAALPPPGAIFSEILAEIRKDHPEYPTGNLTSYLERLQSPAVGGVIRSADDGRFRFVDAFHHLYAHLSLGMAARPKPISDEALMEELAKQAVASLERLVATWSPKDWGDVPVQLPLWPDLPGEVDEPEVHRHFKNRLA